MRKNSEGHLNRWALRAVLLAALLSGMPEAYADFVHLTLQSQPGDFIGQGKSFDLTYNTPGTESISTQIRRTLPDGSPAELLFVLDQNDPLTNTFALLFFGTDQLGIPIQAGTYGLPGNTAQRADFAQPGHAGLDVSFQNRGSNTLTGNFTINDVDFFRDAANVLQVGDFDVTFEQHSEGATPALFGHFTYQNALFSIPEPGSMALATLALTGLLLTGSRRRSVGDPLECRRG